MLQSIVSMACNTCSFGDDNVRVRMVIVGITYDDVALSLNSCDQLSYAGPFFHKLLFWNAPYTRFLLGMYYIFCCIECVSVFQKEYWTDKFIFLQRPRVLRYFIIRQRSSCGLLLVSLLKKALL